MNQVPTTVLRKTVASIALMLVLPSATGLMAADWVVEQRAFLEFFPSVTLTQSGATSSHQAVNAAMLELTADSFTSLDQQATIEGNLAITQSGLGADENVQAVNIASAQSINDLTQNTTHNFGTATLRQDIMTGTDNIQSINYAVSPGVITNASQTFTSRALILEKTARTPAGNIQAVNYIKAASYSGDLTQSVEVVSLAYPQLLPSPIGGTQEIRINSIEGAHASANITQSVTVDGTMTVDPSSSSSVVIFNYIDSSP